MSLLRLNVKDMDSVIKSVGKIERFLKYERDDMAVESLHGVAKVWDRNFISEGSRVGGWRELAERTVEERERAGFPGRHPILVRYGDLRLLTTRHLLNVNPNETRRMDRGGEIEVRVSTKNGTLDVSAHGNKAMNQFRGKNRAPRPYWFVDESVIRSAHGALVPWISRRLGVILP